MTFGQVLRLLRKEKNMTQKELADSFGISESTIGMYERGQREPAFETLEAIADYFNVDMDFLMGKSAIRRVHKFDLQLFAEDPVADSPQVRMIARAGKKMSEEDREKMLQLIKVAFPDKFDD